MFKTPILLISWQRPDKTLMVLKKIQQVKPLKIYLACDGVNLKDKGNRKKVEKTREILNNFINWECEIKKLYSDKNLGCKKGVSKAISWFFSNEEEGIILEDDCIPHVDFFHFSSLLLEKYRNDTRIWSISAHNQQEGIKNGIGSYYFSRYSHCWGWATWRRCWKEYDNDIKKWPEIKKNKILSNVFDNKRQYKYWEKIFDNIYYKSEPNTWDYQWSYICFLNSGLTIIPNINLINNIGFDNEATHTVKGQPKTNNLELKMKKSGIFPLSHPPQIIRSKSADFRVELITYSGLPLLSFKKIIGLIGRLCFKIKSAIKIK